MGSIFSVCNKFQYIGGRYKREEEEGSNNPAKKKGIYEKKYYSRINNLWFVSIQSK